MAEFGVVSMRGGWIEGWVVVNVGWGAGAVEGWIEGLGSGGSRDVVRGGKVV